jgi:3-dehydroquinate synthase
MIATSIRVELGPRSYDIVVTTDHISAIGDFARQRCRGTRALLVTDENVAKQGESVAGILREQGFIATFLPLPLDETRKTLETVQTIYDHLASIAADRQTLIVAVGGGVTGDVAGFAAATYARGLPLLMVPTTLLAMVDSSVGGKTGVNHPSAKNLIGAFHQPIGVFIDTDFLATLPDREYRSGLAEVVKYGVILDTEFFSYVEKNAAAILAREADVLRHVIIRCCRLKADIVEKDEREETGLRSVLNYGHTFAHAFETVAGYGTWLHGEAVAAGMICASRLAEIRGLISSDMTERQRSLLARFGLPVAPKDWPADELIAVMKKDKKATAGRLPFVLPNCIGHVALFDDISEAKVRRVIGGAE